MGDMLFTHSSLYNFMFGIWTVVISAIVLRLVMYWIAGRRMMCLAKLPTLGDFPFLGSVLHINRAPSEFLKQLTQLCDKFREEEIFSLRFGNEYFIEIYTANQVEKLLRSYEFLDKSVRYDFLHKWLGTGLLTSTGKKWKARRRMLTPSFYFSILKDAFNTMNDHAADFRDLLMQEVSEKNDKPIDIFRFLTLLSLDIIGETAMSVQMDALHNDESEYVKAVLFTKDALARRMRTPWLVSDIIFENTALGRGAQRATDFMHQFAYKVIRERRVAMGGSSEDKQQKQAFLDILLNCRDEDGNPLSDEDIREEVDTFMFEGHDTVSSALGFTTYLLGCHPEIQDKCYQELLTIVESPRNLSMEDLSKMVYLEWCIKESMRLYPPVPFLARAAKADIELAGYKIPKDTAAGITVIISGLHRDPAVFPEPDKFDPTRFSPDNSANRHPYAYIPFSAGPRNCIGQRFAMMELKVVVATLLLSFEIKSTQKESELGLNPGLVLQPDNGILVELQTRNQK